VQKLNIKGTLNKIQDMILQEEESGDGIGKRGRGCRNFSIREESLQDSRSKRGKGGHPNGHNFAWRI